jgi:hypothetical protein
MMAIIFVLNVSLPCISLVSSSGGDELSVCAHLEKSASHSLLRTALLTAVLSIDSYFLAEFEYVIAFLPGL